MYIILVNRRQAHKEALASARAREAEAAASAASAARGEQVEGLEMELKMQREAHADEIQRIVASQGAKVRR